MIATGEADLPEIVQIGGVSARSAPARERGARRATRFAACDMAAGD